MRYGTHRNRSLSLRSLARKITEPTRLLFEPVPVESAEPSGEEEVWVEVQPLTSTNSEQPLG
ncbi:hypothetical protein F7734_10275 [Scytonema sp. UIC 10036]|uniref:hypothetical protein n=1 Tax=Scytonema sp. UIC 10036 TaxID=2304196 RepID=UPI0012DA0526|nr:hypothetical protein [Scytonema sp. UIC 10036]MUG92814.1 hypothetical protein [Scytonema sp. UIC 10036]